MIFIEETTQKQTYKNKQFHLLNFNSEIKRKNMYVLCLFKNRNVSFVPQIYINFEKQTLYGDFHLL